LFHPGKENMIKKLIIVALIAGAALGGYFVYQNRVNKQQLAGSNQSTVFTNVATRTTTQAIGPVRTFKLAPTSLIKWTGYKKVGRHSGWFILFDGEGKMPGTNIEQATIDLSIETDSCETDNAILTGIMKDNRFFHCEKFPASTFKSVSIVKTDKPDIYTVTGNLLLRDVTKTIQFPAKITVEGGVVKLEADFKVNRRWWGIVYESVGDSFLEDDVRLELKAEAKESAEK
jgi:polyisoprenoid-binding protein YceI